MVYDGTKNGLNAVLWAPWFPLPMITMHLQAVILGTYMGDIDIGDMFYPRIQAHAGIDLTPFFPEEVGSNQRLVLWGKWERCVMGYSPRLIKPSKV
jgi:hypothetical protein